MSKKLERGDVFTAEFTVTGHTGNGYVVAQIDPLGKTFVFPDISKLTKVGQTTPPKIEAGDHVRAADHVPANTKNGYQSGKVVAVEGDVAWVRWAADYRNGALWKLSNLVKVEGEPPENETNLRKPPKEAREKRVVPVRSYVRQIRAKVGNI